MSQDTTLQVLNDLLHSVYRSLPRYLVQSSPWRRTGDDRGVATIQAIADEHEVFAARIIELIRELSGQYELGEFSMEFTDMNFLSVDFLVRRLVDDQRAMIARTEQLLAQLPDSGRAHDLTAEVLGSAKAHLEMLEVQAGVVHAVVTMPRLFDTHAHLDQEEFDADRADVVSRAAAAGVECIVAVGTTAASSRICVELARQFPLLRAAVGLQPNYCAQAAADDWEQIVALAAEPEVVALGETGLDRYWDYTPLEQQQDYFDRHLRLSQAIGLPVVIHTRDCDADVLAMLRDAAARGPIAGVMHSFTGAAETAAECVALGLYISFAGMVTFKKSDALRAVATTIPADRLLIETDSPYLSPHPKRGKRNEPAHLLHTAECLAEVRGLSLDELAELTTGNARRLFARAGKI